jgi:hypothetical protein
MTTFCKQVFIKYCKISENFAEFEGTDHEMDQFSIGDKEEEGTDAFILIKESVFKEIIIIM